MPEFGVWHHAPEGDIAIADFSEHCTHLDLLLADYGDHSPILDFLHGHRSVASRWFANRCEQFPILLDRPGLPYDVEGERKQVEFQELFAFVPLSAGRKLEMMKTIGIKDDLRLEIWITHALLSSEDLLRFLFSLIEILIVRFHCVIISLIYICVKVRPLDTLPFAANLAPFADMSSDL